MSLSQLEGKSFSSNRRKRPWQQASAMTTGKIATTNIYYIDRTSSGFDRQDLTLVSFAPSQVAEKSRQGLQVIHR